jgi:hypothetical protein
MSKFGLDMNPGEVSEPRNSDLASRLANFPPSAPRAPIDIQAADAAGESLGFVSREATPKRRRRVVPTEPKRQLSILMPVSKYDSFVAYADRHRLTYEEVISRLMDRVTD